MTFLNPTVRKIVTWAFGIFAIPLSIAPFYAYARYDGTGKILALEVVRHFQGPTLGSISAHDAARYRALHLGYRDGLVTLAFGGVMDHSTENGPTPESTTITTTRFADDMRMLVAAGYHTVTPAQVAAWHAGRASLPANALLLTFDGGRTDTVLNAAPILHGLHLRATVFVIGGAYKQAPVFYASPTQLRSLEKQGWSIEAHAIAGHSTVPVADGHHLPYLAARALDGKTLEDMPSFTTRVAHEYDAAKTAATAISHQPVIAYSWPFGAYGADARTNDHRTAAVNVRVAASQFALGFNDDGQDTYTLASRTTDALRISRLRVDPTITPNALFNRLELAIAASGTTEDPHA
ncbi:MAG TPA: polysaccharide deacetylase family protein [Gaiellales bacterium]|jgi:biofilm PGA synthesis lipoprotein PgaB